MLTSFLLTSSSTIATIAIIIYIFSIARITTIIAFTFIVCHHSCQLLVVIGIFSMMVSANIVSCSVMVLSSTTRIV